MGKNIPWWSKVCIAALVSSLVGCATMDAEFPVVMPDGSIKNLHIEGSSPGAVCVLYERAGNSMSFMLSTRPESDFGTSSTIEAAMGSVTAFFTREPASVKAAHSAQSDACAFRYTEEIEEPEEIEEE